MDAEELKMTWEALSQHIKRESAISLALYTDRQVTRLSARLRPVFAGQVLQIFFGIAFVFLAAVLWSTKPTAISVIVAGVVVHAYGIGCIIAAGVVIGAIYNLDYSRSVLEIQEKLTRARRAYIIGGIVGGLTWWFLWIPLLMVLLGLVHVNLYAHAPAVIWSGMAVGIIGLSGMLWLYACSRKPGHDRLRRFVDQAVIGRSLQAAQAQLDELRQFTQEG